MKLVAIVALFVCTSAHAGADPSFCYAAANFVQASAEVRDSGVSEARAGAEVVRRAHGHANDMLSLLHSVYASSADPVTLANVSLKACLK